MATTEKKKIDENKEEVVNEETVPKVEYEKLYNAFVELNAKYSNTISFLNHVIFYIIEGGKSNG